MPATVRERRVEETRYAITVLGRAAVRIRDAALEDLITATDERIGAGPIFDRAVWDIEQAELKRLAATARATLDYRRRLQAIADGQEA